MKTVVIDYKKQEPELTRDEMVDSMMIASRDWWPNKATEDEQLAMVAATREAVTRWRETYCELVGRPDTTAIEWFTAAKMVADMMVQTAIETAQEVKEINEKPKKRGKKK